MHLLPIYSKDKFLARNFFENFKSFFSFSIPPFWGHVTPCFGEKRGKLDEKVLDYGGMLINDTVSSHGMQSSLGSCSGVDLHTH